MKTPTLSSRIEILESRIAPAAVFVNATTATYVDANGDHATVKFSLPILTQGNVTSVLETSPLGFGEQLQEINVAGITLPAATTPLLGITVTAVKAPHTTSDGLVNVGLIDATGINLGVVSISGDLGAIEAGTGSATPAIAALNLHSMGLYGTATQASGAPTLTSNIDGTLTSLKVSGDVKGVYIDVSGGFASTDKGNIGSIHIGGSLIGGGANNSGNISTTVFGNIGPVKIGGDILGGGGTDSGQINSAGAITSLTIDGSIIGGSGQNSGQIETTFGGITTLTIGGSIVGGAGEESGGVELSGAIGTAKVGGSLLGGTDASNFGGGTIHAAFTIGSLTIGGSVIGGAATFSSEIICFGTIGSVTIGGSLIGAAGTQTGAILTSVGSSEGADLGPVKIGGSLIGEGAGNATDSGEIVSDGTITSVTIGGSLIGGAVTRSGYISSTGAIGAVKIGKDLLGGQVTTTSDSGEIDAPTTLGPVTVGGSVIGGGASYSGEILSGDTMGAVKIGGNLLGGPTQDSGGIQAHGNLASVTIGGSVYSGTASFTGEIESEATLGPVTIKGSVGGNAADPVLIRGQGALNKAGTTDIAIASLSVGGQVEDALILAGFGGGNSVQSGNAQIGAVKVGGDWIASSISAGCEDTASGGISAGFGNDTDFQIPTLPGGSTIDSRIASITIGGTVIGDAGAGDHFGFDAQKIGSFRYSGTTVALPTPQPPASDTTIALSLTTQDVAIELVS